jgi:hypothetical protein
MEIIDIVLTTYNRLDYLKRTLGHLYARTRSPYVLHVVDDGSSEGNADYLITEWKAGRVHDLVLRGGRCGAMANLNAGAWLAFSDPTVFVDDDVLCPDVEPDWLARGTTAILERPNLAILALNHPGASRKPYAQDDAATYCKGVGGTFMFVRRRLLLEQPLPHERGNFSPKPTATRCNNARAKREAGEKGYDIGYLTHTYCYHFGHKSARHPGQRYRGKFVEPEDWKTLAPPKEWRK